MIIIGSEGLIGKNLVQTFQPRVSSFIRILFIFSTLKILILETLPLEGISQIIIVAGCPNIDICEYNPIETYAINLTETLKLAEDYVNKGL